jgi:DNA-binding MarR family transcriptional regulator
VGLQRVDGRPLYINDMNAHNTDTSSIADRIARECVALRVQLLNRVVTRLYDEALQPLGLTMNQVSILTVLEKMGEARPGDICAFLQTEKSTISRSVKLMRERKWVSERPGADARSVRLTITPKGRALLARAFPIWEKAQKQARELLGEDGAGAAALVALVDRSVTAVKKT